MKRWHTVGPHDVSTKMHLLEYRGAFCPDQRDWHWRTQNADTAMKRKIYDIIVEHWPEDFKTVVVDRGNNEVSRPYLEPIKLDGMCLTFHEFYGMVKGAKDKDFDLEAIAEFFKDMLGEKLELLQIMLRLE